MVTTTIRKTLDTATREELAVTLDGLMKDVDRLAVLLGYEGDGEGSASMPGLLAAAEKELDCHQEAHRKIFGLRAMLSKLAETQELPADLAEGVRAALDDDGNVVGNLVADLRTALMEKVGDYCSATSYMAAMTIYARSRGVELVDVDDATGEMLAKSGQAVFEEVTFGVAQLVSGHVVPPSFRLRLPSPARGHDGIGIMVRSGSPGPGRAAGPAGKEGGA